MRSSFQYFALFLLSLASIAFAQVDTGTISGTVRDPGGAIIQNALVTVANPSNGSSYSTHTNKDGLYTVVDLKPGTYTVSVRTPGFDTFVKTGIDLRVQDHRSIDFALWSLDIEQPQFKYGILLHCSRHKPLLWVTSSSVRKCKVCRSTDATISSWQFSVPAHHRRSEVMSVIPLLRTDNVKSRIATSSTALITRIKSSALIVRMRNRSNRSSTLFRNSRFKLAPSLPSSASLQVESLTSPSDRAQSIARIVFEYFATPMSMLSPSFSPR